MYDLDFIRNEIKQNYVSNLIFYPEIGSTNTEGLKLLDTNPPIGNQLLLAQVQSAGRGRFQRQWISDPEDSLTFSLVLTTLPHLPVEKLGLLPLLGAYSVLYAIHQTCVIPEDAKPTIKWPNDLLLNGHKACGILSEASWEGSRLRGIVLGIGINVGRGSVPPMELLQYPAGCIETNLGNKPAREKLLIAVISSFFQWLPAIESDHFLKQYQNHLAFMGESVNIFNEAGKQSIVGVIQGITLNGDLILLQEDNKTILCSAGEITVRTA